VQDQRGHVPRLTGRPEASAHDPAGQIGQDVRIVSVALAEHLHTRAGPELEGVVVHQDGPPLSDLLPEHLDEAVGDVDVPQVLSLPRSEGRQTVAGVGSESVGHLGTDGSHVGSEGHEEIEADREGGEGAGLACMTPGLVKQSADIALPDWQRALELV
jgi:hypothetical protein